MTIKILIADDHSMVRQGLCSFLGLEPEFEVVGSVSNGLEALETANRLQPDVILMDLYMPELDGFAATATLKRNLPNTKILALSSTVDETSVTRAIHAGVSGYVLKNMEASELNQAIKAIVKGQFLLAPKAAQFLTKRLQPHQTPETLTDREMEVLRLLVDGKSNKEIAHDLQLSDKTIKIHVSIILAKLGMQSRTQAAVYAARLGLIPTSGRVEESSSETFRYT